MAKERKKREKVSVYLLVDVETKVTIVTDRKDLGDAVSGIGVAKVKALYRAVPLPFRLESAVKIGAPRAKKEAK